MEPRLPDVWATRDLPVLREACRLTDENPGANVAAAQIVEATRLTADQVNQALYALRRANLLDAPDAYAESNVLTEVIEVSAEAYRLSGLWPDAESQADQLLWILEQRIQQAATPEESSKWVRIRDSIASAGREFVIELAAALTSRSMGA